MHQTLICMYRTENDTLLKVVLNETALLNRLRGQKGPTKIRDDA